MQTDIEEARANGSAGLEAMERVLASRTFAKSPRLCSLLKFSVVRSVNGKHNELTEQQIGIQVFGRTPGYNSSEDTIVRGTARHLRQRLEQYYATEGENDLVRISIPRGGYVAFFEEGAQNLKPSEPVGVSRQEADENIPPSVSQRQRWIVPALSVLSAILALMIVVLATAYLHMRQRAQREQPAPQGPVAIWHALFTPGRKTIVVPGDASLDAFVAWEQRDVSLQEYTSQLYHQQATVSVPPTRMDVPLSMRSVTPMADLVLVSALVRAAEQMATTQVPKNVEIRYARNLAIADTHDNNLILIGSETFNPWVTLYQPQMDFVAHFDFAHDVYRIVNCNPRPGESSQYEYVRKNEGPQKALTHIALLKNGQGVGRVFIVEGTSMGTTYGAVNFLTHDSLWEPVLQQAIDHSGQLRDFEVLLSGDFFHGGMGNTRVIALHVH